jgi:hypothetical protein
LRNSCLSRIRAFVITLVILALASSSVAAEFSQGDWRYVKDIILPPGLQPEDLVELVPDPEVFAAAAAGLADLRIMSDDNSEIPYKLEVSSKGTPARDMLWASSILSVSRDTVERTTNVDIDLGTPGLPSYRLTIGVPDVNFYREVTLEASTDRENWSTIMRGAKIHASEFTGESLTITYPETTSRYLRLVIHDEDSPPLTVQEVEVWGLWRRLVFVADPQQSYKLYYGNADARRPTYDIERVFPYPVTEELPEAELGPQTVNPHFVEQKPPVSERFPWLLPTVMAVAAVLLALLLFRIFRQARKVLPPPQE